MRVTHDVTFDCGTFASLKPLQDVWMQSQESAIDSLRFVTSVELDTFPNVPVFNALGNHDVYPVDQYQGGEGDSWLLQEAADQWGYWVSDERASKSS